MEKHTLKEIKAVVESSYPTPVAAAFKRCRTIPGGDLGGKHRSLIDLFEAFIKFLTVVQLQEARRTVPDLRETLIPGEDPFEFLRKPTLGGWAGLLRELCKLRTFSEEPVWMKPIASWYLQGRCTEAVAALDKLSNIEGLQLKKGTSTPIAEICGALVTYRNKKFSHAPHLHDEELRPNLAAIEEAIACLIGTCSPMTSMNVFHVEKEEVAPNSLWHLRGTHLVGAAEECVEYVSHHQLLLQELYLAGPGGELTAHPLPLGPFLLWKPNERMRRHEAFFYERSMRTRLEYISYSSGASYYHSSGGGFKDLVSLELRPGLSEAVDPHLADEERVERAEHLYKKAMVLIKEQKYEEALETLEMSVEYERRSDTLLAIAKTQALLEEPQDVVSDTLCACLSVEPANLEAQAMLEITEDEQSDKTDALEGAVTKSAGGLTVLHALTPPRLREYTVPFWFAVLFLWYGFSAIVELVAGHGENLFPNLLQVLCCVLWSVQIVLGHSVLLSLEHPLSMQLHAMRLDRFKAWFRDQVRFVIGNFVLGEGGKLNLAATLKSEALYWGAFPVWTLGLGFSAFFLSAAHSLPFPLALKRLIDYSLIFALAYPVLRFAAGSSIFILRYSRLSLRPVLTRLNEWGVRSFKSLIAFNSTMTALVYLVWWVMVIHSLDPGLTFPVDIFFLGITTVLYAIWTVMMPVTIRVAVGQAKGSAVHTYAEHIERAFRHFVDSPGEDTLERYRWLLKHQGLISRIGTWPLSIAETLVYVVGSNLVLLLVDFWYVSVRLGYWPHVTATLRAFLKL